MTTVAETAVPLTSAARIRADRLAAEAQDRLSALRERYEEAKQDFAVVDRSFDGMLLNCPSTATLAKARLDASSAEARAGQLGRAVQFAEAELMNLRAEQKAERLSEARGEQLRARERGDVAGAARWAQIAEEMIGMGAGARVKIVESR